MEISSLTDGGNKEEMVILIKNFGENDLGKDFKPTKQPLS